eukprot:6196251-Alexandrium_andersonii.AAC.1
MREGGVRVLVHEGPREDGDCPPPRALPASFLDPEVADRGQVLPCLLGVDGEVLRRLLLEEACVRTVDELVPRLG